MAHLRNRTGGRDDEFKSFSQPFGVNSVGGMDQFGSPLITPRRHGSIVGGSSFADESRSNSLVGAAAASAYPNLPFDHALTNPFTNADAAPTFGVDSFSGGLAPSRNTSFVAPSSAMASGKKSAAYVPASLMDIKQRNTFADTPAANNTTTTLSNVMTRSPVHASSARRNIVKDTTATPAMPFQSLRDSAFMKNTNATPATNTSRIHATPFDTDASPLRSLDTPARIDEHKDDSLRGSTLFATPAASSALDSAFLNATPAAASSTSSSAVVQSGLGFGSRQPNAVTVFGFNSQTASRVLSKFYSFGELIAREDPNVDESVSGVQPNFIHLYYRTPVAASMALAQNGRIIDGCMIGVKSRTELPSDGAMMTQRQSTSDRSTSIFDRHARQKQRAANASNGLTADSIYASSKSPSNPNQPHKSICTKLMENLWNW